MPVKRSNNKNNVKKQDACPHRKIHNSFVYQIFCVLLGILLVYVIILVGTVIRNNLRKYYYIGHESKRERTITVQAEGRVTAAPDIAITTIGMVASGENVVEAQKKNTEVMNNLIAGIKKFGVKDKDIQTTNYNIYPQYNYSKENGRELVGYEVSQNVTVKIRDLDKANDILALAGEVGANSVSGLAFTVDDREVYRTEARDKALEKVANKARALSRSLGVEFVSIISYDEYEGGAGKARFYESMADSAGFGGNAPDIESGSMDVVMNVTVVFEIR